MQQTSQTPSTQPPQAPQTASASTDYDAIWQTYRPVALAAIVVALLAAAFWGAATYNAERQNAQVQKEYLKANDEAARAAFAKRHPKHPLGGLVLLNQGHAYFSQGNYAAAKSAYEQARQGGLKNQAILREQAVLGEAFCQMMLNPSEGLTQLEGIVKNPELMDSTRAYAAYELTGYYVQKQQWEQAKNYLSLINTLESAPIWKNQARLYSDIYPQLAR